MNRVTADGISRITLLELAAGAAASIEQAEERMATRIALLYIPPSTAATPEGQAAILTAVALAVRAFGTVEVHLEADAIIGAGPYRGSTLQDTISRLGTRVVDGSSLRSATLGLMIGGTEAEHQRVAELRVRVIAATWSGWHAKVGPDALCGPAPNGNLLAAMAAAALGVSELFFDAVGDAELDFGYRNLDLDLWRSSEPEPELAHAPANWWLIGLGHLGQAYAWVISHLPYESTNTVEVVVQDVDRLTDANYCTGVLTSPKPPPERKTRVVAASLEQAGFTTRILEQRLTARQSIEPEDAKHVALIGVDNFPTRRLSSNAGWERVIDAGLGATPADYTQISIRSFPGAQRSDEVQAWQGDGFRARTTLPDNDGFRDLATRVDECGLVEIAGKAVGVPFVGMVAAAASIAEALRDLHGGPTFDITAIDARRGTVESVGGDESKRTPSPAAKLRKPWGDTIEVAIS